MQNTDSVQILTVGDDGTKIHLYGMWFWAFDKYESTVKIHSITSSYLHRFIFTVYDLLTGQIVKAIRGHRDIVRDVAWHPTRNEILTSSWDYNLNINTYQSSKKSLHKRLHKDMNQDHDHDHDNDNDPGANNRDELRDCEPPPRRSRRIAMRQENGTSSSGGHGSSSASTSQQF